MIYKNLKLKKGKGFTLMETLVAISILLIAVVVPLSTIGGSTSYLFLARDQMTAINFAQEGIEVVRQKRDSNMLSKWKGGTANWSDGLSAGMYIVDAPTLSLAGVAGGQPIYQEDATGLFHQFSFAPGAGYTKTHFMRTVKIEDISLFEKKITSTVTWLAGSVPKNIEVKESIFGVNS